MNALLGKGLGRVIDFEESIRGINRDVLVSEILDLRAAEGLQ
jgi:hypothetical protein